MAGGGFGDGESRGWVERAVRLLLDPPPERWSRLHVEHGPQHSTFAVIHIDGSPPQALPVPAAAADALGEYLGSTGADPRSVKVIVDCLPDGTLSATTAPILAVGPHIPASQSQVAKWPKSWPRRLLMAATVLGVVVAAILFATGWRWLTPHDADIDLLPAPPPRQQQAFAVLDEWFRVLRARDVPRAQALSCPSPTGAVLNDLQALQGDYLGGIDYPEAIVDFRDEGHQVVAKVLLRTKPITDEQTKFVQDNQGLAGSGLSHRWMVLVDDGNELKVCGSE